MALLPEQQLIAHAVGYTPLTGDDAEQPYPVETVLPADRIRPATDGDEAPFPGWPMVRWHGGWYPAPAMDDVETWVFDSTCPTPDGSDVEPDAPESWLSILGMI